MRTNSTIRWVAAILLILAFVVLAARALAQETKPALSLRLVSSDYSNPVKPGSDNAFRLVITNTGKGAVTNIRLSSFQPRDWAVEFSPPVISQIPENGMQTVDINVRPPENVGRGYQSITITAQGITAQGVEATGIMDIAVNVERGTSIWLWIGIALAVVVVGGFILVFIRLGR